MYGIAKERRDFNVVMFVRRTAAAFLSPAGRARLGLVAVFALPCPGVPGWALHGMPPITEMERALCRCRQSCEASKTFYPPPPHVTGKKLHTPKNKKMAVLHCYAPVYCMLYVGWLQQRIAPPPVRSMGRAGSGLPALGVLISLWSKR